MPSFLQSSILDFGANRRTLESSMSESEFISAVIASANPIARSFVLSEVFTFIFPAKLLSFASSFIWKGVFPNAVAFSVFATVFAWKVYAVVPMVFRNSMFLIAIASASIPQTPRSTPGFILHGPLLQSWQLMPCSQNEQRLPCAAALSKEFVTLSLFKIPCIFIIDSCALTVSIILLLCFYCYILYKSIITKDAY